MAKILHGSLKMRLLLNKLGLTPLVSDGTRYHVKVNNQDMSAVFSRRDDARDYKRSLKKSLKPCEVQIIEHKFQGGLQIEERVVS